MPDSRNTPNKSVIPERLGRRKKAHGNAATYCMAGTGAEDANAIW